MTSRDGGPKTIQSVQTAFDIIEIIATQSRPTASEIAAEIGYSRSTTHYHLQTLQKNRYVARDDDGFRLGLRLALFGQRAVDQHELIGVAERTADGLAAETDLTALVAVPEEGMTVCLYRTGRDDFDRGMHVGEESDLHCTAFGQAILSWSSDVTVDNLINQHGLSRHTNQTLTDREILHDRLETVRNLGFAYSAEEYVDGTSSVAAPILDRLTDRVVGAIGVMASTDKIENPYKHTKARRFSDELPEQVQRAARIVSDKLSEQRRS
ncbi:IclR family transcriptional regulator [Halegenticoccus tardaugens]|uniref:IclR family transcriptional regulator n=1 Tax=Halegenticoccus tardaugens TaxID=2071624 RepID=UPI001E62772A|nr:IclR family transcriptional regulator [Halegenticoccus tardaugens]